MSSKGDVVIEKSELYDETFRRIDALLDGEMDWVAAMATVASELNQSFDYFHWTGFYRVVHDVHDGELVIGPYQGGHGCLRIAFGRGVCGTAATTLETQLVPNVDDFPGHIACSSSTQSEIVVPIIDHKAKLLAVLDVDSDHLNAFDKTDKFYLEQLCASLGQQFG